MSFIDAKYIGLVSPRLQKFKQVKNNLYNFRCPYCGDSQRHKNKARGYIYQLKNDHNYKCHNCGMSKSFTNFLKDLDQSLYDQYVMERYKQGITGRNSNTPNPTFDFKEPTFKNPKQFDLPTIAELNNEHPAKVYLKNRKIPDKFLNQLYYCEKFKKWTNQQKYTFESIDQDEPRIIIPLINQGEIIGFQGRSLNKYSKIKYITIILDESHPKIYGIDNVKKEKTIYVTEGPLDSMFICNSIAMCGADADIVKWGIDNFVRVYDNEPRNTEIVSRYANSISRGERIVIWPNSIKEKDINDMVLSGLDVQSVIESNTYSGLEAKLKFTTWKKI
jgi:predicted RNA-binding Zn-ribbon protein involved in translation (DUF1610 family)